MGFRYPITLELDGRACVVVGGGGVAEQKVAGLLEAGARVSVVAPVLTTRLDELAQGGTIEAKRRQYRAGDLEGAFIAIAATDDSATNARVFEEAERRGVLLNAVDDVDHCHFAAPSTVRRGDFLLAISTGGKAPALAKRVRQELSERFGPEWETLVDLLAEVRAEALAAGVREGINFEAWAERWQEALDGDLVGLVAEGRTEEARARVRSALVGEASPPPGGRRTNRPGTAGAGKVSIVGAGPGDPGLLTLRAREALDDADVIVYDRLVHPELVAGKPAVYAGKRAGQHHLSQHDINRLLIKLARKGKRVVRLKGGDPFVFGRGAEEAEALASEGVAFEVVPAPTSAIAALAYAGIPVTDRRLASSVAIVTAHCASGRAIDWRRLATSVDTIVVLMGLDRLHEVTGGSWKEDGTRTLLRRSWPTERCPSSR